MLTMSKRSISITTSSANRSHNHLPPPAVVVSSVSNNNQRIPGILSIPGLDLRPQHQQQGRKPPQPRHRHSASQGQESKKKPPRPRDGLPTSTSMPTALDVSSTQGSAKPLSIFMSHPSGRLARARAKRASLSNAFPKENESGNDPFLASPIVPTALPHDPPSTEATGEPTTKSSPLVDLSPSPSSPRRRSPKSKSKFKAKMDRNNNRTKERRKENKHMRSAMKERVAEVPSDSAPEDMVIDPEDVPSTTATASDPSTPSSAAVSATPITPPNATTPFGNSAPHTIGISVPISVPRPQSATTTPPPASAGAGAGAVKPQPHFYRNRIHNNPNSTPSTPPRTTPLQSSTSSRTLPIITNNLNSHTHTRTQSHPNIHSSFPFHSSSTSAPCSPSAPHLLNSSSVYNFPTSRYANSTFQHSPSPNVLPKPKFLESVFMEMD